MPLRVIRDLLEREDAEPERLRAMIELEDQILERALAGERERIPAREARERYDVPREVLARLAELGVLSPEGDGYSPSDVRIIEAISRSGPAATTSGSGSPSTTRCATSRHWSRWSPRRSRCSHSGSPATWTPTARSS